MFNRRQFVAGLSGATAAIWLSPQIQAGLSRRRCCPKPRRTNFRKWDAHAETDSPPLVSEPRDPQPACILIWLDGGAPTIDMWDLKRSTRTRGPFRPIPTAGDMEICEHLSKTAKVMDKLSIVRSMSTRESAPVRGYYYGHTSYVPNPNIEHPSVGAVIAHALRPKRSDFKLPGFVSINGPSIGAGYLGGQYAPLVIDSDGRFLRHVELNVSRTGLDRRLALLNEVEASFAAGRGPIVDEYQGVKQQALNLMTSDQIRVFQTDREDPKLRDDYGDNDFGRGVLMARRLVEAGVSFVEVNLPGWDVRQDYFRVLREKLLPTLDSGLSTLVRDLESRGLLDHTVIVVTGPYGRAPRTDRHGSRGHWSRSWSLVVGGGGLKGGIVVGETNADGTRVNTEPFTFQDLWATVGTALGISLNTVLTSRSGRPMRIFNSGKTIQELLPDPTLRAIQFNRKSCSHRRRSL